METYVGAMEIFVGVVGVIMVFGVAALFWIEYNDAKKEGLRPNFTHAILTMTALGISAYGFRLMQINLTAESIGIFVLAAFFSVVLWSK